MLPDMFGAKTIGVGPGFTVGHNVNYVVESNRGHNCGRVFYNAGESAQPDTGTA